MIIYSIILQLFLISTNILPKCQGSWKTGLGQYHIQTDEGPERFFRYQTDNGQFRKEKRLEDGTVTGTYAWIDAAGVLRQEDYIADNQGYRILKSKEIYVGKDRSIEEAMHSVKSVNAQAGILVKHNIPTNINFNKPKKHKIYSTPAPFTSVSTTPTVSKTTFSSTPYSYLGYDHYSTPQVIIRHHSQPIDNSYYSSYDVSPTPSTPSSTDYTSTITASPVRVPSRMYEPPFLDKFSPIAVYSPTTTPSPITSDFAQPIAVYSPTSTTITPPLSSIISSQTTTNYSPTYSNINSNNNNNQYGPTLSTTPSSQFIESSSPKPIVPLNSNDVDIQPLYSRQNSLIHTTSFPHRSQYVDERLQSNNHLGNEYDPQNSLFSSVFQTSNGFRYFLPRQYHEENNEDPNRRIGSFGYIDPFGIRRVIYYNTSPEMGFVHKKNNRYVGFNATPYDPRPLQIK